MIALVGCGFLGSLVAEEIAKRFYAFEMESIPLLLIDFDKVEERNAANQNFTRMDTGMSKVSVVGNRLNKYGMDSLQIDGRLTRQNIGSFMRRRENLPHLIIDAVDNLPTRLELWYYAKQHEIPLLHLSLSQGGTGCVEWSVNGHDSWVLSPINTRRKPIIPEVKTLPPCELVGFRGVGLNLSLAAAKAVGLWYGRDPEMHAGRDVFPGTISVWTADNMGHVLRQLLQPEEVP